jgi:hypothetical protein
MEPSHYEEVPRAIADGIVKGATGAGDSSQAAAKK